MSKEYYPKPFEDFEATNLERERLEKFFERSGGAEFYKNTYGLTPYELVQEVEYGSWKGMLIEALAPTLDDGSINKCPLKEGFADAFKEDGREGVEKQSENLKNLAGTRIDENGKKVHKIDIKFSPPKKKRKILTLP